MLEKTPNSKKWRLILKKPAFWNQIVNKMFKRWLINLKMILKDSPMIMSHASLSNYVKILTLKINKLFFQDFTSEWITEKSQNGG